MTHSAANRWLAFMFPPRAHSPPPHVLSSFAYFLVGLGMYNSPFGLPITLPGEDPNSGVGLLSYLSTVTGAAALLRAAFCFSSVKILLEGPAWALEHIQGNLRQQSNWPDLTVGELFAIGDRSLELGRVVYEVTLPLRRTQCCVCAATLYDTAAHRCNKLLNLWPSKVPSVTPQVSNAAMQTKQPDVRIHKLEVVAITDGKYEAASSLFGPLPSVARVTTRRNPAARYF